MLLARTSSLSWLVTLTMKKRSDSCSAIQACHQLVLSYECSLLQRRKKRDVKLPLSSQWKNANINWTCEMWQQSAGANGVIRLNAIFVYCIMTNVVQPQITWILLLYNLLKSVLWFSFIIFVSIDCIYLLYFRKSSLQHSRQLHCSNVLHKCT